MARGTSTKRLAKWQAPRRLFGGHYLRLSIERWVRDKRGKQLGWGTEDDPFPGKVTIDVYEVDEGKEKTGDDAIARFEGKFVKHPGLVRTVKGKKGKPTPKRTPKPTAARFEPEKVFVKKDGKFAELSGRIDGSNQDGSGDLVWINFEGRKTSEAYRLRIPSDKGEKEGPFYEMGFTITPEKDQPFSSQANFTRKRTLLLAVEPLGQGNWGTLSKDSDGYRNRNAQIIDYFHAGDWKTASRNWGHMIYRWRGKKKDRHGMMSPAGCSITSFTMVIRSLTDPKSNNKESVYQHRLGKGTLDEKYEPFASSAIRKKRKIVGYRYHRNSYQDSKGKSRPGIPEHWWLVRLVWYLRQKAEYYETLDKKVKTYDKDKGTSTRLVSHDEKSKYLQYMAQKGYVGCRGKALPKFLETFGLTREEGWSGTRREMKEKKDKDGNTVFKKRKGKFVLDKNKKKIAVKVWSGAFKHPSEKSWKRHRKKIMEALESGLPVMCLFDSHYIVIVGYTYQQGKVRFILNDPGKGNLHYVAKGQAGGVPLELPRGSKPQRALTWYGIYQPKGWDKKKHARFMYRVDVPVAKGS